MTLLDPEFLHRLEQLALVSKRVIRGRQKGERRSIRRGQSVEFADYRNYVEGDDLRHIDWNIYARLDRLFLKLFLEEEDLHVHILLDASRSMDFGEPNKWRYARQLAAAVAYVGLMNLDRVQIHTFAGGTLAGTDSLRGRRQLWRIFQFLESLPATGGTAFTETARLLAQQLGGERGIVVLITDALDPEGLEVGMKRLAALGSDLYLIHLLSPEEIAPPYEGDLRLIDSESGAAEEISVSRPLLARYEERLAALQAGLEALCTSLGARYLFSSTGVPVDHLILATLREGGLVR